MIKLKKLLLLLLFVFGCDSLILSVPSSDKTHAVLGTISFSGYEWTTKSSASLASPGLNYFSDSMDNLWVDSDGALHLKITKKDDKWYCAELYTKQSFGYGKYIFYTASNLDGLNRNAVLGFFTWDDDPAYHNREIDIEFARWGSASTPNLNYTVQPTNTYTKEVSFTGDNTAHFFNWNENQISFQSSGEALIGEWSYAGLDIPKSGNEKARINLWLFGGSYPSDGKEVEVVIKKFKFLP
jgi:hypothetical protein